MSVDVKGSTGSALLDISSVSMLKFTESGRKENFNLDEYSKEFDKGCSFLYDPQETKDKNNIDQVPIVEPITAEERASCLTDEKVGKRLQTQLFGQSNITRTLNFAVAEEDLAAGGEKELLHMYLNFDFWKSIDLLYIKWTYSEKELNDYKSEKRRKTYETDLERIQSYGTVREDRLVKESKEYAKYFILSTGLENEFAWFLKVFNVGNLPFEVDEIGFEVPGDPKLHCETEGFALLNCQAGTFLPQRVTRKNIIFKFKTDYSVK